MSEDKRKNARLQGRFSDEHKPNRKEKKKLKNDKHQDDSSSSTSSKGKNSGLKPSQTTEGLDLKYDENAKVSIEQLQEKKKPIELKTPGIHELSNTKNGLSRVIFEPDFFPKDEASELFTILLHATQWYDKNIVIHGKEYPQPRLVSWYGPFPYAYSGAILEPLEMTPKLLNIKERIEEYLHKWDIDVTFNSVLLNLYRNGKDSVAWHSDDELSLGLNPTIASVSLGEVRRFEMSMKQAVRESVPDLVATDYTIHLTPGSLIIMDGSMQKDWRHQVPKEYHDKGPRINLTFRTVHSKDDIPTQVPLKASLNSNNLPYPKTEETTDIFDNNSFPPLAAIGSEKDIKQFSTSLSQTKIKSTVKVSVPCKNENSIHNQMDSNENDAELNFNVFEDVPSQGEELSSTLYSSLTDNEKILLATEEVGDQNKEEYNPNTNLNDKEVLNTPVLELQEQSKVSTLTLTEEETNRNNLNRGSQLNAEATEFVPKSLTISNGSLTPLDINYYKLDILELADLFENRKVLFSQFEDFSNALNLKIFEHGDMFSYRDHRELDVLCSINDNTQIEVHRKKILARLCSIVKNAAKKNSVPRNISTHYVHRPSNRTDYRDNYQPRRNSYRGSNYKSKGFKD